MRRKSLANLDRQRLLVFLVLLCLGEPSLGWVADGGFCKTRDIGLLQLVRREGLDLEAVSIPIRGPGVR